MVKLKIKNKKKRGKTNKENKHPVQIPTVHSTVILEAKGRVSKMGREIANITLHRL